MSSKRQQTHVRLLESANKLLTEKGVAVRLEDIAQAAGVSRQTVYLHFGSRHGLLVELAAYLDRVIEAGEAADSILRAPDARAAIDLLVEQRARYIPIIYPVARQLIAARNTDVDADAAYEDRQNARRQEYELLVRRLQTEGLLAEGWEVETAVEMIRVLLSIPSWELLVAEQGWTMEQYKYAMRSALHGTFVQER